MSSSTVGTVKLVNTQAPPVLVTLSTANATSKDSTLSDVTWAMTDVMEVFNPNYAALISLHSISFFNTFENISAPKNVLKVVATRANAAGEKIQDITTITIPPGIYTIATLVTALNSAAIIYTDGLLKGLGNPGDPIMPGITAQAAFSQSVDGTKIVMNAPTIAALNQNTDDNNRYTGFYLIVDDTTRPFMQQLGIITFNYQGRSNSLRTITNATTPNLYGIGFDIGGAVTSTSYFNPSIGYILSPDVINISGINNIIVNLQSSSSNARNSCVGLANSDTMAVVPVSAPSGYMTNFSPTNPFKATITNFQTNQFHIIMRDAATNNLIDFQGVNWTISLVVEYFEIENSTQSKSAQSGNYHTIMPITNNAHPEMANLASNHHGMGSLGTFAQYQAQSKLVGSGNMRDVSHQKSDIYDKKNNHYDYTQKKRKTN